MLVVMVEEERTRMAFEEVFAIQMGRFVPMLTVRVGTETLERGQPVHGSYKLDGIPLYALMGTELELVRLADSVPELRVPGLELGETSA